jgi:hypothetical protein
VVVNMDEAIYMLSPMDAPMLTGMGADGLSVISSEPVDEIVFSWMHDTILTPRSAIAVNIVTADTVVTVTAGDRTKFSTGDVVKVGKQGDTNVEIIRITGYGTTADTLLVSRAWSGTATTYATSAILVGLGTALPEGDDPEAARTVDRSEVSNVTQIFGPTLVRLSATEQVVRKYGVSDEFSHQTFGRVQENTIGREQAFLYGRKVNSTTAKIRTTGGIQSFLQSNKDNTSTQLTVSTITTHEQTVYNLGGAPDRIMANPIALSDLNDINNTSIVRVTFEDARRGRQRVSVVETEFGSLSIVRNRWVLPSDAFGIKRDGVKRRILRPLTLERLAKTGDSDQAQIVCEEGIEVKGEKHMFQMSNLGYTGSN